MSRKRRLFGPIYPLVTPFVDDAAAGYPVDHDALRKYIDHLIAGGGRQLMAASATGRFAQLSVDEIVAINGTLIEHAGARATVCASTPIAGTTAEHLDVARKAEAAGAKLIVCEYPWRYQGLDGLLAYFQAIHDGTEAIEIVLHVTPGRSELGGQYRYSPEDLERICELPRVVGMKEASGDEENSLRIWERLAERTDIIVAGRASETFLRAQPHGVAGFFVGTGNIDPASSEAIYAKALAGDTAGAQALVESHELPFLNQAKAGGWHASLKCALAELDLMSPVERPPMQPVPAAQRAALREAMQRCGWLA